VETALHSFFVSVPYAVAIWMLMLLGVALAAAAMALPRKPARPESGESADDDRRYVGEVGVAADRAAATAARRRTEWDLALQERDAAWTAYDEADRAARRTAAARAYPLMSRRRKPGENADRERYLHHAATAACRNREISIAQLNDVYAHRGWNPRLHPVVQEAALCDAVREHRLAAYRLAAERERAAWEAAELAAEALRSLRVEATAAITRTGAERPAGDALWWSDEWTTAELPVPA
jgi:hypothetical protein